MSFFVKIPFGEPGKASGHYIINKDAITYMTYYDENEGVKETGASSSVYVHVHFSNGKADLTLNKDQYDELMSEG